MATLIPDETIRDIQRAADIVEIVSQRVLLKKAGKNFVGLCPFHTEKTPSFSVNPEKKIFYCFGCGSGGDVFSFLMKLDGLSFPEAARGLARLCGIEIPDKRLSPNQQKILSEKDQIYKINYEAGAFYCNQLLREKHGQNALAYLSERGMTTNIVKKFDLGYAPSGWETLLRYLTGKGMPVGLIQKAGLAIPRKDGRGYYDRFRDRIIFPIFDSSQRIIAFGGRVMDKSLPKYLNSPETPVYHKSDSLYGVHCAHQFCRTSKVVYLVEGYFDLIALHLYGIENCAATLGTSLTAKHVQVLRGLVGEGGKAILVFDSDNAGIKAAVRSVDVFEQGFLNAKILILPSGYDPDTYIREHGKGSFLKLAENALGIIPFLCEAAIRRHGLSVDGKIRVIQDITAPLASLPDTVARSLYVKDIGERLGIDEHAILEKIRQFTQQNNRSRDRFNRVLKTSDSSRDNKVDDNSALELNHRVKIERKLVAMMLLRPDFVSQTAKRRIVGQLHNQTLRRIGEAVLKAESDGDNMVDVILSRIDDDSVKRVVASLAIVNEKWDLAGCQRLVAQFERSVKREDDELLKRIKMAEKKCDYKELQKLLAEKQLKAKVVH